jgi:hypothetical protein
VTSAGCRLLLLAFLLIPAASSAQTGFLQGGYGVEVRRFSRGETDGVLDGNAGTLDAAAGAFLTPRFTASLELDLGASSSIAETVSVAVAGRPSSITTTYESRQRSAAAMAGFHSSSSRRVRVAVYGGLAFISFRREVSSDAPRIVLSASPPPAVFIDRTVAPAVGLDVAARLAPRLDLVGSVRAHGIPLANIDGFCVRPAALLRVTF